jgi:hypothetical protein
MPTSFVLPPRVALPGAALLLTTLWFVVNVPRLSLLDILPFAWTWLMVWLALAVGHLAWSKLAALVAERRR